MVTNRRFKAREAFCQREDCRLRSEVYRCQYNLPSHPTLTHHFSLRAHFLCELFQLYTKKKNSVSIIVHTG